MGDGRYLSQLVGDPFLNFGCFGFDLFGVVEAQLLLLVHLRLEPVDVPLLGHHRVLERVELLAGRLRWRPLLLVQLLFHDSHLDTQTTTKSSD